MPTLIIQLSQYNHATVYVCWMYNYFLQNTYKSSTQFYSYLSILKSHINTWLQLSVTSSNQNMDAKKAFVFMLICYSMFIHTMHMLFLGERGGGLSGSPGSDHSVMRTFWDQTFWDWFQLNKFLLEVVHTRYCVISSMVVQLSCVSP